MTFAKTIKEVTAEDTLKQFLDAWQSKAWTLMADLLQITWSSAHDNPRATLIEWFDDKELKSCSVVNVTELSSTSYCIMMLLSYNKTKKRVYAMVIKESAPYIPDEEGVWGVNPLSIYRQLS